MKIRLVRPDSRGIPLLNTGRLSKRAVVNSQGRKPVLMLPTEKSLKITQS